VLVEGSPKDVSAIRKSSLLILGDRHAVGAVTSPPPSGDWSRSRGVSIEVRKANRLRGRRHGAGKSTLLKSIAGAERSARRLRHLRRRAHRRHGAASDHRARHRYVPENRRLFPRLSVRDNCGSAAISIADSRSAAAAGLVFKLFPRLSERLEQRAETLFRRRAADAPRSAARLMTRPRS